jgi:hypothetical protein
MCQLDTFKLRIHILQKRLHELIAQKPLLDTEVLYLSKRLDLLINKADRLRLQQSRIE